MALKLWPDDKTEAFYCDGCGKAMASVILDSQDRVAEIRLLPTPTVQVAPVPPPPAPVAAPKPIPAPPAPAKAAPTYGAHSVLRAARAVEGYDLLALMGWKG